MPEDQQHPAPPTSRHSSTGASPDQESAPNRPPGEDQVEHETTAPEPATEPAVEAADPETTTHAAGTEQVTGRRVTTRTTNRREVTEHTQETITEHIPLEAYQGPGSAHPAPVG